MPFATIDGIKTNYQVTGSGTPLLMLAPGGFDSSIMRWSASGAWKELQPLNALADQFQVIAYDRREAGDSGGRLEALNWECYVKQAMGLLDHLGIESAYVLGGCMGVSVALATLPGPESMPTNALALEMEEASSPAVLPPNFASPIS